MEKISYNLVFNRKKRLNKKGMALVQVEAYLNRRKIYFSTKIYLKPEQWDTKRRMITVSTCWNGCVAMVIRIHLLS